VSQELDSIIRTGKFTFHLGDEQLGSREGEMFLEYEPSSAQLLAPVTSPAPQQDPAEPRYLFTESHPELGRVRKERWNSEQIRDFVRKLGFMDTEREEGGVRIKHFLHLSQVRGCGEGAGEGCG
jgi:hypothetical protein